MSNTLAKQRGRIKFYNPEKKFGFIQNEDMRIPDTFLYNDENNVDPDDQEKIAVGVKVLYGIFPSSLKSGKTEAKNVSVIEGGHD